MPEVVEKERLVESIVRLRRIARRVDDATREELDPILDDYERLVGPTLNRSQLARLLGVSHTAVARWIRAGDLPTVLTPSGRAEVSTGEAVLLRERLDEAGNARSSRALAEVIHRLQAEADELDLGSLLPCGVAARARERHGSAALSSLIYHRVVAGRLDDGVVLDAKRRLRRWVRERRIHPAWAEKWEHVLAKPRPDLAIALAADTEQARSLRQSSPFAGALTEHERHRVLRAVASASS